MQQKKSFIRTASLVVSLNTIGYFVNYLAHIYLANILSPEDYGDFAVALALAMFFSFVAELGASKSMLKYIPQYSQTQDGSRMAGILRAYVYSTVILGLLIAAGTTLLAYLNIFAYAGSGNKEYHPLLLALWLLPLLGLSKIGNAILRSHKLFTFSEPPTAILLPGLLIFFLWVLSSFGFSINDWFAIGIYGVCCFLIATIYLALSRKYISKYLKNQIPTYELKEWLSMSIPIMFSLSMFLLMRQIDLIMMEVFYPFEASVGYFSAAAQTSEVIILVYTSLAAVFTPFISQALMEGAEQTKKILLKMMRIISYFCVPLFFILVGAGKWILDLFGPEYTVAYPALVILAFGFGINAIFSGCNMTYMQFSGQQYYSLVIQVIAVIIDIVLNYILIPIYGTTGAAIATTTALIFISVCVAIISWYKLLIASKKEAAASIS